VGATKGERRKIGVREVRALRPNGIVWDAVVPGFGARKQRSEAVAYVLLYRTRTGRQRWHTIGRYGAPWTPDEARTEAKRLLGAVAAGRDPAAERRAEREFLSVAQMCDAYMAEATAGRVLTRRGEGKRPRTLAGDEGRIARHIKPLLGRLPAAAVTGADVERFMHRVAEGATAATVHVRPRGVARVRGGRATASRTIVLLQAVYAWAERKGIVAANPVRGIRRFADGRRERRLKHEEYAALGAGLRGGEAAGVWPFAVAAVRFLALTGWRRNEAALLRWRDLDLTRRTAWLNSKTGRSMRPLSNSACDVLRSLPGVGRDDGLVFSSTRGASPMNLSVHWARIAKLAGLPAGVTPHVLRHSFASLASDLGYSEATVAALIGHRGHSMTSRYTHAADAVLLKAADDVAERTAESMGDARSGGVVVPLALATAAG
jgi:integrase